MPIAFRILPELALVHVTYSGVAGLAETIEGTAACAAHPDFRPSHRHLVDLRGIDDFERDLPGFLSMQARVIDHFPIIGDGFHPFMMVMIAPSGPARGMAEQVRRTWEGLEGALVRVVVDEASALSVLGLEGRGTAVFEPAAPPTADETGADRWTLR